MPEQYTLTITADPDPGDVRIIENGLTVYNLQHAPAENYQLYLKLIYTVLGRLDDLPQEHSRYFLQKRLSTL